MATAARTSATRISGYPAANLRFDWLMAGLAFLFIIGLHLDGWAHNHGRVDETFFTPWHAVLYGSFGLVGLALVVTQFRNVSQGYSFTQALPRGYGLALVGVLIFGLSGGLDFVWHDLFGFEPDLEALMSPAHMALATGAFLFISAPLRAVWSRKQATGWRELAPAIISLTLLLAFFSFFTQYANYLNYPEWLIERRYTGDELLQIVRYGGIFLQSAFVSGLLLFGLRRWQLPVGTVTLMLTVSALLYFWMRNQFIAPYPLTIAAPIIAGILLDSLLLALRPSGVRIGAVRLFAFLTPAILILTYFAITIAAYGIIWSIHMWLGAVFIAGLVGLGMSYLVFPPVIETE
ncbi:MAG: hypothetical protein H7X77_08585 [Anaerolineae bacterium]|nr:hypothetical protein [Anaerolineae bacterium]